MNMPSHHQSSFFDALFSRDDIDLQVRYYEKVPEARKKLGWKDNSNAASYEQAIKSIYEIDKSLPDWKERVHMVPGFSSPFLRQLIDSLIDKKIRWVHWSERSGVGLAKLLQFNYSAYKLINPIFLSLKGYKKYAKQINTYGLGALAIGKMAKNDFITWGVKSEKIAFQPYSLAKLEKPKEVSISLKRENELVFMYIGSLYKLKGIDLLIKAFSLLSFGNSFWKLIFIGSDLSEGLYKKQAIDLGIEDRVNFLEVVQSDKINNYLDRADVFVLPTRFDGWGAVLNEAASLGKPLISTDQAGAAHHLIQDGKNGYMVKAGSIDELIHAMQYYVDYPEKIQDHGNKSFEIFQSFTPEKTAELFVSNIKNFLELSRGCSKLCVS